jgi:hypothetical protein
LVAPSDGILILSCELHVQYACVYAGSDVQFLRPPAPVPLTLEAQLRISVERANQKQSGTQTPSLQTPCRSPSYPFSPTPQDSPLLATNQGMHSEARASQPASYSSSHTASGAPGTGRIDMEAAARPEALEWPIAVANHAMRGLLRGGSGAVTALREAVEAFDGSPTSVVNAVLQCLALGVSMGQVIRHHQRLQRQLQRHVLRRERGGVATGLPSDVCKVEGGEAQDSLWWLLLKGPAEIVERVAKAALKVHPSPMLLLPDQSLSFILPLGGGKCQNAFNEHHLESHQLCHPLIPGIILRGSRG